MRESVPAFKGAYVDGERESESAQKTQCERRKKKEKEKEKETPVAHFTDDALFAYINLLARNGNCNGRISSILT